MERVKVAIDVLSSCSSCRPLLLMAYCKHLGSCKLHQSMCSPPDAICDACQPIGNPPADAYALGFCS